MMKFKDIEFKPFLDGVSTKLNFGHLSLSIVKHSGSYGSSQGLYEIAMFNENDDMIEVPGITNEGDTVKGWLTESDVTDVLEQLHTKTGTNPVYVTD